VTNKVDVVMFLVMLLWLCILP